MKITIEPTPDLIERTGTPVRVWKGKVDSGGDCLVLVAAIVLYGDDPPLLEGLKDVAPPNPRSMEALIDELGAMRLLLRELGCPEGENVFAWAKRQRAYLAELERLAGADFVTWAKRWADRTSPGEDAN